MVIFNEVESSTLSSQILDPLFKLGQWTLKIYYEYENNNAILVANLMSKSRFKNNASHDEFGCAFLNDSILVIL